MKRSKKIFSLLLMSCILLSAASCTEKKDPPPKETEAATEEASPFDVISAEEKEGWREHLIKCLTDKKEQTADPSDPLLSNIGAALIDVDLDGFPELALTYPGGSAGNTFVELFDIKSGESVGFFSPGRYGEKELGELALFLNTETSRYIYVGLSGYRGGASVTHSEIYTVAYSDKLSEYSHTSLFSETYEEEANGTDVKLTARLCINGSEVSAEDYVHKKASFWQKLVRIDSSDVVYVSWESISGESDSERAAAMADALINSTQVFIRGDEIN